MLSKRKREKKIDLIQIPITQVPLPSPRKCIQTQSTVDDVTLYKYCMERVNVLKKSVFRSYAENANKVSVTHHKWKAKKKKNEYKIICVN